MNTTVDGEFQRYAVESGAYIREHFFGPDPRLRKLVEHLSDEDLRWLPRGGHDYRKLYAAYKAATEQEGAPTVILAKTVKGWTLGSEVEGRNATHQIKKMTNEQLLALRERLYLQDQIPEESLAPGKEPPYYRPPEDSDEYRYMMDRRTALDGAAASPSRDHQASARAADRRTCSASSTPGRASKRSRPPWRSPACSATSPVTRSSAPGSCPSSPTRPARSGWTRCSASSRSTRRKGQKYDPVDAQLLLSYTESKDGQILEEGITEAGSMASFTAAGTAYATRGVPMVPFFIFYSMFGFQRVGDLIWAAADARARGFLLGATAGRTTLLGEGLQHQDGHSHLLASTVPSCEAYDPAFAYEMAAIIHHGIDRMYGPDALSPGNAVFYYLTLYNENYVQPAKPETKGIDDAIISGLYKWADAPEGPEASRDDPVLRLGAARRRARRRPISRSTSMSPPSSGRRPRTRSCARKRCRPNGGTACTRARSRARRTCPRSWPSSKGPIVAVTDYLKAVPDQIANWVPDDRRFITLGTDGFGRSDTRDALRRFFETDAGHVAVAALAGLADEGQATSDDVAKAIAHYQIDTEAPDPRES